jgi:hypothetical protein
MSYSAEEIVEMGEVVVDELGWHSKNHCFLNGGMHSEAITAALTDSWGNTISILQDVNGPAMEVRIFGEKFTTAKEGNPVICVNENREMFRFHGEMYNAIKLLESAYDAIKDRR